VPKVLAELTLTVPFNDFGALDEVFRANRDQIAAAIVEPVVGNAGCIPPQAGFLEKLRSLTAEQGTVLIIDEVMTGFRVAYGGAQQLYDIKPDLTTLGKIIGGGLPVGAYGGRATLMDQVAPAGQVYQAGTLSGNPLAVVAGLKTLEVIQRPGFYQRLEALSAKLASGLADLAQRNRVPLIANRVGSMFTPFFTSERVTDYVSAKKSDAVRFGHFFRAMLARGVYFAPSQFEAAFVSAAHSEADIEQTVGAAAVAFREL
jgi:glutamate-1-semialdehyde 2,1-aminomutase